MKIVKSNLTISTKVSSKEPLFTDAMAQEVFIFQPSFKVPKGGKPSITSVSTKSFNKRRR